MPEKIIQCPLEEAAKKSGLEYALSVIIDRALPDVRDGMKPVHRRIAYSMHELGLSPEKAFKKSARIVGDVLGKFHPHGDTAVYEAMVKLVQDFNSRYQIVNGHGNYGSIDGDSAAAMRYTEAKLTKYGEALLTDINKNTVDFIPNYDGEELEPKVLPGLLPNLLANGSYGIAVGMATSIPSHNLNDIYDALNYIIDVTLNDEEADIDKIMDLLKGPDFATGGIVYGDIREAYKTGRGSIKIVGKYEIEDHENRQSIIITEIPYRVNKANLIKSINDLSCDEKDSKGKVKKEGKLKEIKEVRDESSKKEGIRIVIDLKKDVNPNLVVKKLMKHTKFQDFFSIQFTILENEEPVLVNIKSLLESFLLHAVDVVRRRTVFDIKKNEKRLNVVNGVVICLDEDNLDRLIDILKISDNPIQDMIEQLNLNKVQAEYILDTSLRTITKNGKIKYLDEKTTLENQLVKLSEVIKDNYSILETVKSEFLELRRKFGDERRTEIIKDDLNIDVEDLIKDETLVITYSTTGIIKSIEKDTFKIQKKGGKGVKNETKDDDYIKFIYTVNSKDNLLFMTNKGRCHILKAYKIDKTTRTARGRSIFNYLSLDGNEKVITMITINSEHKNANILFITKKGIVKRLSLNDLSNSRSCTKVINFKEDDKLVQALIVEDTDNVLITTRKGNSIKFSLNDIRATGRNAAGVRGIKLKEDDYVVDIVKEQDDSSLLIVTENGMAKRTSFDEFNLQNRGGKGVISYKLNKRTGKIISALSISDNDELLFATKQGQMIRIKANTIKVIGRNTSGVNVVNLNDDDKIASITKIMEED